MTAGPHWALSGVQLNSATASYVSWPSLCRCWHPFLGETDGSASASSCRLPPVETLHLDSSQHPKARAVVCCATQPTPPARRLALGPGRKWPQCAAAAAGTLEAHAGLRLLLALRDGEGGDERRQYDDHTPSVHMSPPLRWASRPASLWVSRGVHPALLRSWGPATQRQSGRSAGVGYSTTPASRRGDKRVRAGHRRPGWP